MDYQGNWANANHNGWGIFGRSPTVIPQEEIFFDQSQDELLRFFLPAKLGKKAIIEERLPPYGYGWDKFRSLFEVSARMKLSHDIKVKKILVDKKKVEFFCKAVISHPGNFGIRVEGRDGYVYSCPFCKGTQFSQEFPSLINTKKWSELTDEEKKEASPENTYACGIYNTLDDYITHLYSNVNCVLHQAMGHFKKSPTFLRLIKFI